MEKTNKKGFLAWFTDNWKRKPLFSTGIALLVMVILQILALGFDYASFGEWFAAFSRNWINILRNNAGVGIIALGMTFVIISGGIDLAVGSTMVAIGAVIMSSISRLLVFIGLPSTYDNTITGIMLIVIVVVDALTQRRSIEMARRKRLLSRTAETAAEGECHQA